MFPSYRKGSEDPRNTNDLSETVREMDLELRRLSAHRPHALKPHAVTHPPDKSGAGGRASGGTALQSPL